MANEGASCWICLEEGPDESGQPLRRDCSCRGEHAGFAHLSCTINYAKQKSKNAAETYEFRTNVFVEPWEKCHHCKQKFRSNLALELSAACVTFAENTHIFKGNDINDQLWVLEALQHRVESITLMGVRKCN